ncbi:hypothetical protein GCM10023176_08280 [Micromonospora coerulea]|uniref:Uncharacterized protein n=1 Tax=Micromonospora coerulea TaxID=47856 RepID=A0ABP8S9E6_9ACTN
MQDGAAGVGVFDQVFDEVMGDGLPADGGSFLGEADESVGGVEVDQAQGKGAAAAAGGLGVQT